MNAACLTKNGEALQVGTKLDIEFIEIYDRKDMIVTNKPTMTKNEQGDLALLLSGGEFYINITQDGVALKLNCSFTVDVPGDLTGGFDSEMTYWEGEITSDGDLIWKQPTPGEGEGTVAGSKIPGYHIIWSDNFSWINIDKILGEKDDDTTISIKVPGAYKPQNSAVFMTVEGRPNSVGQYDPTMKLPIGEKMQFIFVSESDGSWLYAIESGIVAPDLEIKFTSSDLKLTNTEGLKVELAKLK